MGCEAMQKDSKEHEAGIVYQAVALFHEQRVCDRTRIATLPIQLCLRLKSPEFRNTPMLGEF